MRKKRAWQRLYNFDCSTLALYVPDRRHTRGNGLAFRNLSSIIKIHMEDAINTLKEAAAAHLSANYKDHKGS
ncbi:MAG: hypothetical protein WCR52_17600, partial [Bacteroidota bacterium]